MIDMPQTPPSAYEQVLTQKLLQCGLRSGGFTVRYEDELQSVHIVIEDAAEASTQHLDCIRRAAKSEIVAFKDPKLQEAYSDRVSAALRPRMLAKSEAELRRRGLLQNFPERSKFSSDKLFAEALERHCGLTPGSFFADGYGGLMGQPALSEQSKADQEKISCLWSAMTYANAKGEGLKFGFIGNEALAPDR